MELKLKVLEGKNAGQEISVPGKKFFIGRAEDCHLRPGSDLISRHHCVLLVEEGYLAVRDFGSKNGTFVNDERVLGEQELKAGDRLTVGPLRFEIHMAHGLADKKRPPVVDIKQAAARTAQDASRDPMDVTQWLETEEEAEKPSRASTETVVSMSETESINLGSTQTVVPEGASAEKPKDKRVPGKLPPVASSTKDSKDAAAAILAKMRKKR